MKKDVVCFEIHVNNFMNVDVVDSSSELDEVPPEFPFREVLIIYLHLIDSVQKWPVHFLKFDA